MNERHVAFVTDADYLPWCATAIRSLVDVHGAGMFTIHLVHDGSVAATDVAQLRSMVGPAAVLADHAVDPSRTSHLPAIDRFGSVIWLRFLLAELLPDVERVLYLDADVLVVDRLDDLFDADLDGSPVAAVANIVAPDQWDRLAELGIVDPAHFFNSGVLLMDLARMRHEGLVDQVSDAVRVFRDSIRWPDQDALNVVCAGRWRRLDPRFNVQSSLFAWGDLASRVLGEDAVRAAVDRPAIVHFEGPHSCKPWHRLATHPWRDRYRQVLHETPWADQPLVDDVRSTRAIAALPERLHLPVYRTVFGLRRSPRHELGRLAGEARARVAAAARPARGAATRAGSSPGPGSSRRAPHPLSVASEVERQIVERCLPYTMGSIERLLATMDATAYAIARDVPGSFVECGVWRGGSVLAMVLTLLEHGVTDRDVFLFDTFSGMTEPTDEDTSAFHPPASTEWTRARAEGDVAYGDLFASTTYGADQVRRLLHASGYPMDRVHLVIGPVEQTLPDAAPSEIAVLRLDTDWYESTRHELEHLYPRIPAGGVLIVDDYGHWEGARRAVDEYLATQRPLLSARSDYTGRMSVKQP